MLTEYLDIYIKTSEYGQDRCFARLPRFAGAQALVAASAAARVRHHGGHRRHFGRSAAPEEGSLYPALYRMEEAGWIRAEWIKKDTGRRARIYELTAAGKKQLGIEESRWQSVSLAIHRVLREA